jgi:carbon storage regulator
MLILSRKEGETIVIQGGIKVQIRTIRGSRVQIGIEAPADVQVRRGELESKSRPSNPALTPDLQLASVA